MKTYSLAQFDLYDPSLQLESEALYEAQSELLFALAVSVPLGLPVKSQNPPPRTPTIHDKIMGVVAVIDRLKNQLIEPQKQRDDESRLKR
ncbi:hypothetical protein ACIGCM_22365 [Pseudomonas sp. NPDC078700]|uniref:hypothetical protein n=1 Tax=Pseudomonas sp. NPDC078700 TaxID=3364424 RepID=UPI0037C85D28